MSSAVTIALQNSGVNLLSGGLVKTRKYTFGRGCEQTTEPADPIGTENRAFESVVAMINVWDKGIQNLVVCYRCKR